MKTLGLAVVAVLALTALCAAASASAAQFRASSYPQTLTGEAFTAQTLATKTGNISCSAISPSGTVSEASNTITVTPAFSGCKEFGVKGTVLANSCSYVLHSTSENHPFTGSLDVACSKGGDAIEASSEISCVVRVPAQTGLTAVEFTNGGNSVLTALNVANLKYTETGSECAAPGEHTAKSFTGSFFVEGVMLAKIGPGQFQSESYPALAEGSGSTLITVKSASFNCTNGNLSGQLSGAVSSLNLNPAISGCTTFGIKFSINANGCYFTAQPSTSNYPLASGPMAIGCAKAGSAITFTIGGYKCEVAIPAQSGLSSLGFEDTGTGISRAVNLSVGVSGLEYTETGSECFAPGTHTDGKISGTFNLKGYAFKEGVKGAQQGLWID